MHDSEAATSDDDLPSLCCLRALSVPQDACVRLRGRQPCFPLVTTVAPLTEGCRARCTAADRRHASVERVWLPVLCITSLCTGNEDTRSIGSTRRLWRPLADAVCCGYTISGTAQANLCLCTGQRGDTASSSLSRGCISSACHAVWHQSRRGGGSWLAAEVVRLGDVQKGYIAIMTLASPHFPKAGLLMTLKSDISIPQDQSE
jgi:hypothetical protein